MSKPEIQHNFLEQQDITTLATRAISNGKVEGDITINLDSSLKPKEQDFASALKSIEGLKESLSDSITKRGANKIGEATFVYSFSRNQNGIDFKATGSLSDQNINESNIKVNIYGATSRDDAMSQLTYLINKTKEVNKTIGVNQSVSDFSEKAFKNLLNDIFKEPESQSSDALNFGVDAPEEENPSLDNATFEDLVQDNKAIEVPSNDIGEIDLSD